MQETDLQKAGEDHNAEGDEDVEREKQHCIRSARVRSARVRVTSDQTGERRRVGDVPRRKKFGSDSTYICASDSVIVWVLTSRVTRRTDCPSHSDLYCDLYCRFRLNTSDYVY
jgi:hypothetical protein